MALDLRITAMALWLLAAIDHRQGKTLGEEGGKGNARRLSTGNAIEFFEARICDDLGGGETEGRNVAAVSDEKSKSLEMLRQISSTGYLRKRLPQELMVLQGGASVVAVASGMAETRGGFQAATVEAVTTVSMDVRAKAKMQGYEGDPCGECGNYTLVRNGTCMKCNTCGGTSGCS